MSLFIKFYFTSSVLNKFRTLIHPSSRACDFSIVSPHWSRVLVSMCVGSFGVVGLEWYPCDRLKLATRIQHLQRSKNCARCSTRFHVKVIKYDQHKMENAP